MAELDFLDTGLMPIHYDDQVTIYIANNLVFHKHT